MTDCQYERKLHAYYDGELPARETREVEEHVRQCAACAAELEELRRLSGFFAAARVPELQEEALERLRRGRGMVLDRAFVRVSEYFTAAAAAILLGCGVMLYRAYAGESPATNALPQWQLTAVATQADTAANEPEMGVTRVIVADLTR